LVLSEVGAIKQALLLDENSNVISRHNLGLCNPEMLGFRSVATNVTLTRLSVQLIRSKRCDRTTGRQAPGSSSALLDLKLPCVTHCFTPHVAPSQRGIYGSAGRYGVEVSQGDGMWSWCSDPWDAWDARE
jgi:hypothetical protein